MTMSNRHFQSSMTMSAQAYTIVKHICFILELEKPTPFYVVNVKGSPAGGLIRTTVLAHLVPIYDLFSNVLPVAPMPKFFATSPVSAIFADHEGIVAFSRTKTPSILNGGWKGSKDNSTIFTSVESVLSRCSILAFSGTVANQWASLVELFTAILTGDIGHSTPSPVSMAFCGAKAFF